MVGTNAAFRRYSAIVTVVGPARDVVHCLPNSVPVEPVDDDHSRVFAHGDTAHDVAMNLLMLDRDFVVEQTSAEVRAALQTISQRSDSDRNHVGHGPNSLKKGSSEYRPATDERSTGRRSGSTHQAGFSCRAPPGILTGTANSCFAHYVQQVNSGDRRWSCSICSARWCQQEPATNATLSPTRWTESWALMQTVSPSWYGQVR